MLIFPIPMSTPPPFLLTLYSPQEWTIPLHALQVMLYGHRFRNSCAQPRSSCLVCRNLQACVPCQPLPAFYLFEGLF